MSSTTRRRARDNPGTPTSAGPVGRGPVLALFEGIRTATAGGHGATVMVTGEPGIGKTTVAAAVAAAASRDGWRTIWSTCWENAGPTGYWPWAQVLRALIDDGIRYGKADQAAPGGLEERAPAVAAALTFPPPPADAAPAHPPPAADRFQLFDELLSLILAAARAEPLLLVFDDLQWADPGSTWLLARLARRVKAAPVLVLLTLRDGAARNISADELAEIATQATTVPLGSLTPTEIEAVMTTTLGRAPTPQLLDSVCRRSGGNPFFVQQLIAVSAGHDAEADTVPLGVRESIERRLAQLDPEAVNILGAASVLGQQFTAALLCRVTGAGPQQTTDHLDTTIRAGIVSRVPTEIDSYRFTHDLFREALVDRLAAADLARLHRQVGAALAQDVASGAAIGPGRLAQHYAAGGPDVAAEALRYATLAGAEAGRRFAHVEAAQHWRRAVHLHGRLHPRDTQARGDLLLELGDARRRAGELPASRTAYLEAADLARGEADTSRLARSALGLQAIGSRSVAVPFDELVAALEEAAEALGEQETPLRATVLACLARELAWKVGGRRDDRAAVLADIAVGVATRCGDAVTIAGCLLAQHNALWVPGNAGRRLALARRVLALGEGGRSAEVVAEAQLLAVSDLWESANPLVHQALGEFLQTTTRLHQPRWRHAALTRRAAVALTAGHLSEAEGLITEASELADEIGEPDAADVALTQLWELRGLQGRRVELLDEIAELLPGPSPAGVLYRAAALLDAGDQDAARAALAPLRGVDPAGIPRDRSWLTAIGMLSDVAAALRLGELCLQLRDLLSPHAGEMVVVGVAVAMPAPVDLHLGRLSAALGDLDRARGHFRDAIATAYRLGADALVLRGRLELAQLDFAQSDPDQRNPAQADLVEIIEGAQTLGLAGIIREAQLHLDEFRRTVASLGELHHQGGGWTVSFAGLQVRLDETKGLRDLATLVRSPGIPVRAVDLIAAADATGTVLASARLGADEVLDERGRRQVRSRLAELDREVAEAESFHDPERAAQATRERAALLDAMAEAVGLGGRPRRLGDTTERARKAVTARVRDAIARIEDLHPALGAHLRASVTTGTFCCYSPATAVDWVVD